MKLRARAKINRTLFVVGTRPDGYHQLKTIFQSLLLHDTLAFETREAGLELLCGTPGIPRDERNLVWKAATLVWSAACRPGDPAGRVRLTKRIPAQGGLGGGSADGAAALVGWDRLWQTGLSPDCLRSLAARLGADVPFFLVGGTALGLDRGDELYPLVDLPPRWVVLVLPPFGVSTPEAFRWWDEDRLAAGPRYTAGSLEPVAGRSSTAGSRKPEAGSRFSSCVNDLEGPVSRRHPELADIRGRLEAAGAESAAMTGSGSTVFGLFAGEGRAREAAASLDSAGWRTMVTRTATRRQARLGGFDGAALGELV
jgi:4-diphosphocytidyl-2-C-methyl-D-erythritol kinase